jgi:SPP1 family predicted phage head-tail adaptor
MDKSDVIKLISVTRTQDKYGQFVDTETSRQVYCQVGSITQSEFYEGGRNGLNPEYRFTVFFADYEDETIIEYKGKRYAVYRTYLARNDRLELYVERKGGTNGQ